MHRLYCISPFSLRNDREHNYSHYSNGPGLLLLDVLKWPGGLGTFTNVINYYVFVRLFDWLIVWLIDYSYLKKKRILWKFICAQFFLPKEIDTQIFISSLEMTSAIYNKTTTTTTRCQNWNYIIICRFSGKQMLYVVFYLPNL